MKKRISARAAAFARLAASTIPCLCLTTLLSNKARAVNAEPNDYVVIPSGVNLAIEYLQFSNDNGLNVKGPGNIGGKLQSEIGIFRFIHYSAIDGVAVNWQFIVPFGSVNNVDIGGMPQNSSSGVSDPIIGGSIWPINMPETATYLGITPLLTLPIGKYHSQEAINIGNNRLQGDLQVAFQTALGKDGPAHRFVVALYGDGVFYGDNDRYAGHRNLSQNPSWQVQSWLTYAIDKTSNVSVGYSYILGGRQSVNNAFNGLATHEEQVRLEVQKFFTPRFQVTGQLTHDIHVDGGFTQEIGVNARLAYVF